MSVCVVCREPGPNAVERNVSPVLCDTDFALIRDQDYATLLARRDAMFAARVLRTAGQALVDAVQVLHDAAPADRAAAADVVFDRARVLDDALG